MGIGIRRCLEAVARPCAGRICCRPPMTGHMESGWGARRKKEVRDSAECRRAGQQAVAVLRSMGHHRSRRAFDPRVAAGCLSDVNCSRSTVWAPSAHLSSASGCPISSHQPSRCESHERHRKRRRDPRTTPVGRPDTRVCPRGNPSRSQRAGIAARRAGPAFW